MFDRSLHTGNVAVAFATVASAAADPLTLGVAGALISGALSGTELFKNANRAQKSLAKEMADVMQASIAEADMPEDRRKHVTQMLSIFPPGIEDLARGSMVASTIANNMRAFVAANARDGAHKGDDELDAYAQVMRETLAPFLTPDTLIEGMLAELLARTEKSGDADRMRDEGITEKAIIRLAQRIAGETDDLGQAWLELQNAMDIAVRVQQEGRVPSNHGDFVDEVLKRVTALSADGEYTQAGEEIAEALAKVEAEKARLLRSGIEMAMLAGDSARTAALLVQLAEAKGQAGFEELRALWLSYYERGRDKGIALDLRIAIDLAKIAQTRAANTEERGIALNNQGAALQTLGERESDPVRLEQAVVAYEAALQEWTQHKVPMQWAVTQNNLGNALKSLGERDSNPARLEQAVAAFNAALQERTQDKVPMQWAMTQNNLGNALRVLGERDSNPARLEQAVAAYRAALQERTQDKVPMQWAMTQNNLGNALRVLGARESNPAQLEQAVLAFQAALQEQTQDKVPLDWAMTQNNLGNALQALGERQGDPARLEQAELAFQAALTERTQDKVPLDWAMTQNNLGNALQALGKRESDPVRLEQAVAAYKAALEEWTQDKVPLNWAMTQGNLANLHRAFFDVTGEAGHLDKALQHAHAAREVFAQAGASQYLAMIDNIIAEIEARRAG